MHMGTHAYVPAKILIPINVRGGQHEAQLTHTITAFLVPFCPQTPGHEELDLHSLSKKTNRAGDVAQDVLACLGSAQGSEPSQRHPSTVVTHL